jgi:GNAT superfamily N-acetyltransferase
MNWIIKKVDSKDLYPVRNKVLRDNKGYDYCKFDGDDFESSLHFAAFNKINIVGGVSLIENYTKNLQEYQNNNIGQRLLEKAESISKENKYTYLWMNARKSALNFYVKNGYKNELNSFNIEGIGEHYFLYKNLNK